MAAVVAEATGITGPRMLSFADKLGNYASCGHLRNAVALKRSVAPKKGQSLEREGDMLRVLPIGCPLRPLRQLLPLCFRPIPETG